MMIKAVIFDLDGTLCYFKMSVEEAMRKAFQAHHRGHLFEENRDVFNERNYLRLLRQIDEEISLGADYRYRGVEALRRMFAQISVHDEVTERIGLSFVKLMVESVELDLEANGVIESLKLRGLKIGLLTNGPSEIQWRKIELLGIREWFDAIVVSGDIGMEKPDPRAFQEILVALETKPREALYVGDSPYHDVLGAKGAGLFCVWLNKDLVKFEIDEPKPDFVIRELKEVLKII
jgi:HAD superfamily hydrolase (TIGR01549 family)